MDSRAPPNGSQLEEEFTLSQPMLHPSPYYPYSSSSLISMAYGMPPHGFSAMLTSSSPGSPMHFGPPRVHSMPCSVAIGETTSKGQANHQLVFGESQLANSSSKPRKTARTRTSTKEGLLDVDDSAPKRGGTSKVKSQMKDEDDDNVDKVMWKDFWVEHLIHIRGGMAEEFSKTPKQGVDLWGKVATKLASMFSDCDKDGQACRKNWARVNKTYREDKAHNAISCNDRKRLCKWYDVVDEYMHDRANVVCKSHASSLGDEIEPSGDVGSNNETVVDKKNNSRGNAKDDALRELVSHMKEESNERQWRRGDKLLLRS